MAISNTTNYPMSEQDQRRRAKEELFLLFNDLLLRNKIEINENWVKKIVLNQTKFHQIIFEKLLYKGILVVPKESITYNENAMIGEGAFSTVFHCEFILPPSQSQGDMIEESNDATVKCVFKRFRQELIQSYDLDINDKMYVNLFDFDEFHIHSYFSSHDNILKLITGVVELGIRKTRILGAVLENCQYGSLGNFINNFEGKYKFDNYFVNQLNCIVDAIRFIHSRGFLHRDIKLDNVMVSQVTNAESKNNYILKLGDFSISCKQGKCKSMDHDFYDRLYLHYAPELFGYYVEAPTFHEQRVNVDWYAFGCLLREIVVNYYLNMRNMGPAFSLLPLMQFLNHVIPPTLRLSHHGINEYFKMLLNENLESKIHTVVTITLPIDNRNPAPIITNYQLWNENEEIRKGEAINFASNPNIFITFLYVPISSRLLFQAQQGQMHEETNIPSVQHGLICTFRKNFPTFISASFNLLQPKRFIADEIVWIDTNQKSSICFCHHLCLMNATKGTKHCLCDVTPFEIIAEMIEVCKERGLDENCIAIV